VTGCCCLSLLKSEKWINQEEEEICTLLSSEELGKFKRFWRAVAKNLLIHYTVKIKVKFKKINSE
jgi:hypothetical protein